MFIDIMQHAAWPVSDQSLCLHPWSNTPSAALLHSMGQGFIRAVELWGTLNMKIPMEHVRLCLCQFMVCVSGWLMISFLSISFGCEFGGTQGTQSGSQLYEIMSVCLHLPFDSLLCERTCQLSTNNLDGIGMKPVKLLVIALWLPKVVPMMMNVNWSLVPTWLHCPCVDFSDVHAPVTTQVFLVWLPQPSVRMIAPLILIKYTARGLMLSGKW